MDLTREEWCRRFVAMWSVLDPAGTTYAPMEIAEGLYENAGHMEPEDAARDYVQLKKNAADRG